MAIMKWDESMSVGVFIFDQQHKKLIGLINQLHDAMVVGKGKEVLGEVLTELIRYTEYHFKAEEKLFEQYAFPDVHKHTQEHAELTTKAKDLKNAFDSGKTMMSLETMNFLKNWLNNHIMKSDKLYGPFLNSKGVK